MKKTTLLVSFIFLMSVGIAQPPVPGETSEDSDINTQKEDIEQPEQSSSNDKQADTPPIPGEKTEADKTSEQPDKNKEDSDNEVYKPKDRNQKDGKGILSSVFSALNSLF